MPTKAQVEVAFISGGLLAVVVALGVIGHRSFVAVGSTRRVRELAAALPMGPDLTEGPCGSYTGSDDSATGAGSAVCLTQAEAGEAALMRASSVGAWPARGSSNATFWAAYEQLCSDYSSGSAEAASCLQAFMQGAVAMWSGMSVQGSAQSVIAEALANLSTVERDLPGIITCTFLFAVFSTWAGIRIYQFLNADTSFRLGVGEHVGAAAAGGPGGGGPGGGGPGYRRGGGFGRFLGRGDPQAQSLLSAAPARVVVRGDAAAAAASYAFEDRTSFDASASARP